MAHLPPRAPNMTPNWPDFSLHQKMDNLAPTAHNLWADEFLDISSRRGSHRRSMSDSIAFLESPMVEECRRLSSTPGSGGTANGHEEYERFDDEQQIMSMFNDDIHDMSCSNPSSPSEYINDNEDKSRNNTSNQQMQQQLKSENEEVQSLCKTTEELPAATHNASTNEYSSERVVDPKRIKRILANRQSAQRSRVRKLQYVSELERNVSTLQAEVSILSPRVAFLDHQRLLLNVDNSSLRQKIAALAQDKLFKDAHQEALKREIESLSINLILLLGKLDCD
ncbi:hypothetical protein K7X08_015261 [Anisodus acutangulus]|uniref:BZIP domain-containing protein n=1 Tax=Anisodus acutangulus TaxID=402998 RepID=A0A9Q1L3T3_9SOLA|nr:hypothetical protein K7X08_015261 [Anisodus acutangulus]